MRRVESAITDVRSAHLAIWSIAEGGRRTKVREIWYQAGRWRMEDVRSHEVQVFADGKLWHYEPETRRVTVRKAAGPAAYNPSGFTVTAMKRDHARWGWRDQLRMLDRTSVGGRPARQFIIELAHLPERSLLLVDAATDLPIRTELQREVDGRWVTEGVVEHRFNERLPARLFRPKFPNSGRVSDLDAGRRRWSQRLAKGIARRRVEQRPIVIRDLKVNGEDDVFVLYTASKFPGGVYGDWEVDLTDEFGTRYLPGSDFQPYAGTDTPISNHWAGYRFDGEKLKGRWWAPLTSQRRGNMRRFTLTFHVVPINHRYIHLKRQGKPLPENADYSIRTAFRFRVDRPTAELLPESDTPA
jgi:hypothetical protein